MKENNAGLIAKVVWLLEQMNTKQICRVLSVANRVFVTECQNTELLQPSDRLNEDGQENPNPHPQRKRL